MGAWPCGLVLGLLKQGPSGISRCGFDPDVRHSWESVCKPVLRANQCHVREIGRHDLSSCRAFTKSLKILWEINHLSSDNR